MLISEIDTSQDTSTIYQMKEEESHIQKAKEVLKILQKDTDYYFQAFYQYEGQRKVEAITRTIHDNFILPCWVQRYITVKQFIVKGDQKEEIVSNYLNMLDYRVLRLIQNDRIEFSVLDQNELKQMQLLRQLNKEIKGRHEAENYRVEAISLYTKWEKFLQFFYHNEDFKAKLLRVIKKTGILRVYIIQRMFRGENTIKIYSSQNQELSQSPPEADQFLDEQFYYFRDIDDLASDRNLFQQGSKNYSCLEKNYFIPYQEKIQNISPIYQLNLKLSFEKDKDLRVDRKLLYYRIPQNTGVKLLQILVQIKDEQKFLDRIQANQVFEADQNQGPKRIECFSRQKFYNEIGRVEHRNMVSFPFQEPKFQRNKINLYKHFHLAFQGGGAKGLAYVGAYKSIRQQNFKNPYDRLQGKGDGIPIKSITKLQSKGDGIQRIPIKSIMGSSAGGIIALAISTGIPQYQLQKICYKMNSIPSNDRFTPSDPASAKAKDDYGNQITLKTVKQSLVRIFDQYGIVQKSVIEKFFEFLSTSQHSKQIQDKLLKWLAINSNAMAQILTLQQTDEIQPGFFNKLFGKAPEKISRKKINWEGLLLHGALMKGETIHDIAKDCVVKFLFKERMYRTQKQFAKYLQDCEDPQRRPEEFKYQGIKLNNFLTKQLACGKDLLQLKLHDVWNAFGGHPNTFGVFLVGLINRFIVLLDNFHKLGSQQKKSESNQNKLESKQEKQKSKKSKGLILQSNLEPQVLVNTLPFRAQYKVNDGLIGYFKKCFLIGKNLQQEDIKSPQKLQLFKKIASQQNTLNNKQEQQKFQNIVVASQLFQEIQTEMTQKLSYSQINSLLNKQNLIDPSHLQFEDFMNYRSKQETIIQYLLTIFGEQIRQLDILGKLSQIHAARFQKTNEKTKNDDNVDIFFYSLEAAQSIYEIYQLIKPSFKQLNLPQDTSFHKVIFAYQENMNSFKQEVAKINMREYYRLTGIELGCTSVDLDSKVLRFFNNKTTPKLPVCRSVQMTGSFPVAFKAQKWKQEWGLYYVFSLEQKHEIDITGHEFTDGGLLANFPIKYMDNDLIRRRYFSHKAVEGQTILLGFGLDYLEDSRYQLTEKQIKDLKKQNNQGAIALQELKNIFGLWTKLVDGVGLFSNTKGGNQQTSWSQIEHWMIRQIPLLRFGLKIVEAYPNADRNLNFQAFDNKVLVQEMWPEWKAKRFHLSARKAEERAYIKQFVDFYHLHLKRSYDELNQNNNRLRTNLQENDYNNKFEKYGDLVTLYVNQRKHDIIDRQKIIKEQFSHIFKPENLQKFKDLLAESGQTSSDRSNMSSTISLNLVNIYFIHLRIKSNHKVVERYNNFYAFIKFIAQDFAYQTDYQKNKKAITTAQDLSIIQDLNRINFQSLYDQQDFQEIARHLGFEGYKSQYYGQLMKKYQKTLNSKNEDDFRKQKKQQTQSRLKKEYSSDRFTDMKLFDVTDSIKRLTQLIYLLVKGRDEKGRLKGVAELRRLTAFVKSTNYKDLFYSQQLENSYRNQNTPLYYCQIIDFFQKQIKQFEKGSLDFYLTDSFYHFITDYSFQDTKNMKIRYLKGMIQHKNGCEINVRGYRKGQQNEKKAENDTLSWLQREYKFVIKHKANQELIERMKLAIKKDIRKSYKQQFSVTSKILFQILYQRWPLKKQDNIQLQQLDDLLIFILDVDNINIKQVYKASIERQEMIKRKQKRAETILLHLLRGYFRNPQEKKGKKMFEENINFLKGIISKQEFCKQLQIRTQQLYSEIVIPDDKIKPGEKLCKAEKVPSQIDRFSLRLVELQAIFSCIQSKIQVKIDSTEQSYFKEKYSYLLQLNQSYFQDIKYLLWTLKQMIFLIKSISTTNSKNQDSDYIVKQIKEKKILERVIQIYKKVLKNFIPKYYSLEQLSLSELTKSKISEPFIIEFQNINALAVQVYWNVSQLYFDKCKEAVISSEKSFQLMNLTKQQNVIRYVYNLLAKIIRHKFSLPLLDIQMQLSTQATMKMYQQKVYNILAKQCYKKSGSFGVPIVKYSKDLNETHKRCPRKQVDSDVHLIIQGVQSANNYFGGLYQNIGKIMAIKNQQAYMQKHSKLQICEIGSKSLIDRPKVLDEEHIRSIKAITCANFHSVFGFLLAMGFSLEEIRKQMFKLKFITNVVQDQVKTNKYFDSYAWANNSSHRHKYLIQELQKHNAKFFDRVDELRKKNYQYTLLPKEFQDLKLIYNHEKEVILQTEARIIDETTESIQFISGNFQSSKYPLEISKTFGYNYLSDIQHHHRYKDLSQQSFKSFKKIAQTIFNSFGSLIQGIVCNSLASHTAINITKQNAKYVAKGLLINRLLSTFKLNDYITKKLKESRLSPNISLAQFYQVSKRKIFLNFTVIDVNRQRLAFLNKNTMPNMPLWAAIIATSSLPFFHQFFEASKQWQATDASSFYDFFVYQFFKADQDKNMRITKYTSGNFISSVPLQLLTNNTLSRKIFDPVKDKALLNIPQFAMLFDSSSDNNSLCDVAIHKRYFNISTFGVLKILGSETWSGIKSIPGKIGSLFVRKNPRQNEEFNISYSPGEYLSKWLGSTTFMSTLSILSNSNDNFILKWYYDKLIRLPIKIDTLAFNEIVEASILKTYKVNVLSEKAQQTIERSYEITSSFIFNIVERTVPFPPQALGSQAKTEQGKTQSGTFKNITQQSSESQQRSAIITDQKRFQQTIFGILNMHKQNQKDRFKVKIRVQLLEIAHHITGFKRFYFKLTFLNHSKWNHNNYNNFVVQYSVDEGEDLYGNKKRFKRANQSEIRWLVESNTIITLRFYYLLKEFNQKQMTAQTLLKMLTSKDSDLQIRETELQLDFKDVVRKLPLRDSYDYQFHYGWQQKFEPYFQSQINPIKRNKLAFTQGKCGSDAPKIKLKIIGQQDTQQFKTKHIIKKTAPHKRKEEKDLLSAQRLENL